MVLEDLFDPHNISAVIRTAEVFGLEDVHVIEEVNPYKVNKSILKGSIKWMNIYLHKKRMACMEHLRKKGYRIAVASTNTNNSVLDLDLSQPTAFYLGSEFTGNHPDTLAAADCEFKLPQYGITESMNVSVAGECSCAISITLCSRKVAKTLHFRQKNVTNYSSNGWKGT